MAGNSCQQRSQDPLLFLLLLRRFVFRSQARNTSNWWRSTRDNGEENVRREAKRRLASFVLPAFLYTQTPGYEAKRRIFGFPFFFFFKFSLLYHLSFLVDVFNNDFCKMCIIITNVLEPGLNLLECVGGQTGSIQMASDGALILRKKCVFVGLPLMRSFNCCDRRYCRKTEKWDLFTSCSSSVIYPAPTE